MIQLTDEKKNKFIETYIGLCKDEVKNMQEQRTQYTQQKKQIFNDIEHVETDLLSYKGRLSAFVSLKDKKIQTPKAYQGLIREISKMTHKTKPETQAKRNLDSDLTYYRKQVGDLIRRRKELFLKFERICRDMTIFESETEDEILSRLREEQTQRAEKELVDIQNLPFITDMLMGDSRFVFITDELKIRNPMNGSDKNIYNLGKYCIRIVSGRKLEIESEIIFESKGSKYSFDHPHISGTNPCFGNISGVMDSLIRRKNIADVLLLSWNFLRSHNEGNAHVRWNEFIKNWKQYKYLKIEKG